MTGLTNASPVAGGKVRLRVLAVIASSELGGAERVLVSLLNGLDRDRFQVWVACHGEGPMLDEYRQAAAGVRSFDLLNVFNPRSVTTLARLMRQLQCQIVHTHLWTADFLGGLAAAAARVPIRVATVHGGYFQALDERGVRRLRKGILSRAYRSVYRPFDRVIGVSRAVAEDLVSRPGIRLDPRKVGVIYNGVDLSRISGPAGSVDREMLRLPATKPVVLTVANFVPIKGHRWLVDAMPRILERYAEASFLLAGDGALLPEIYEHANAYGLRSKVRFVGPRRDVLDLIALSDVVVVPSVSEGFPMIVLEALALGKPVVATRVGGIPEIIEDGKTGLLVAPRDPVRLADAITTVLSSPTLSKTLGENGREAVRARFSAERMVKETEQLYLELARTKGLPPYAP